MTTRSAPAGIGVPVDILTAMPMGSGSGDGPLEQLSPASRNWTTACARSSERTAYPSIAAQPRRGESINATISLARVCRPAVPMGTNCVPSGTLLPRTIACASSKLIVAAQGMLATDAMM